MSEALTAAVTAGTINGSAPLVYPPGTGSERTMVDMTTIALSGSGFQSLSMSGDGVSNLNQRRVGIDPDRALRRSKTLSGRPLCGFAIP